MIMDDNKMGIDGVRANIMAMLGNLTDEKSLIARFTKAKGDDAARNAIRVELYNKYHEVKKVEQGKPFPGTHVIDLMAMLDRAEMIEAVADTEPRLPSFKDYGAFAMRAFRRAKAFAEGKPAEGIEGAKAPVIVNASTGTDKPTAVVTSFDKTESPVDVAFAELFGEKTGARIIMDHNVVGLDKLKKGVRALVEQKKEAFLKGNAETRQGIYKEINELADKYKAVKDDNGYLSAIAVFRRAEQIEVQQKAHKTTIAGFANASVQGQKFLDDAWAYADACRDDKVTDDMAIKPVEVIESKKIVESKKVDGTVQTPLPKKETPITYTAPVNDEALIEVAKKDGAIEKRDRFSDNPDFAATWSAQKTLRALKKYDLGTFGDGTGVDGKLGKVTEAAIKKFQEDYKLPATGKLDKLTISMLQVQDVILQSDVATLDKQKLETEMKDVDALQTSLTTEMKADLKTALAKCKLVQGDVGYTVYNVLSKAVGLSAS
jgi:hypothetical protein